MCLLDRVFPLIVVRTVKRGDVGQVCLSLGRGAVERGVTGQALMRHNIAWKDQNDITKTLPIVLLTKCKVLKSTDPYKGGVSGRWKTAMPPQYLKIIG